MLPYSFLLSWPFCSNLPAIPKMIEEITFVMWWLMVVHQTVKPAVLGSNPASLQTAGTCLFLLGSHAAGLVSARRKEIEFHNQISEAKLLAN